MSKIKLFEDFISESDETIDNLKKKLKN